MNLLYKESKFKKKKNVFSFFFFVWGQGERGGGLSKYKEAKSKSFWGRGEGGGLE